MTLGGSPPVQRWYAVRYRSNLRFLCDKAFFVPLSTPCEANFRVADNLSSITGATQSSGGHIGDTSRNGNCRTLRDYRLG